MSYEGYRELICATGHYIAADAYEDDPDVCERCGQPMKWCHSVDATNGIDEEDPDTYSAPKEIFAYEEEEMRDHRGNTYFRRVPLYRGSKTWRPVASTNPPTAQSSSEPDSG